MPRKKDLKRVIRTRMKKTGESYTASRAHIISQANPQRPPAPAVNYAALAGMRDDTIAAKTGRNWQEWTRALDGDGAAAMPHRDIAALVHTKYRIGDWWSQSVTVGYERIKGLRERGQRRGGTYEATKSKTFSVPVKALFQAWADSATRREWLDGVDAVVRSSTAPKAMRLQWPDGTSVIVGFTAKGTAKSSVALAHAKLATKSASDKAKQYWTARLEALASLLSA